jgi:hypothetical protein
MTSWNGLRLDSNRVFALFGHIMSAKMSCTLKVLAWGCAPIRPNPRSGLDLRLIMRLCGGTSLSTATSTSTQLVLACKQFDT